MGLSYLSIANKVDKVVVIDPDTRRTNLLRKSCKENNFENISILSDKVTSLYDYINDFGYLDIILMDIDGWEHTISYFL